MDDVAHFYDDLSHHYHLLFDDWQAAIDRQAEVIDGLIQAALGPGEKRVLDAACGIGTQALGLAARGHAVKGSDLSPAAIARAKREAEARDLPLRFSVADMRALSGYHSGPFDVVCALDNALPHLSDTRDLAQTLAEAASLLAPGGLFLASTRDYDRLKSEKPRATPVKVVDDDEGRRLTFQVWDWRHDGRGYRLHQYILRQTAADPRPGETSTLVYSTDYWALLRSELEAALLEAGLESLQWHEPEQSGFYQPIVAARTRATS